MSLSGSTSSLLLDVSDDEQSHQLYSDHLQSNEEQPSTSLMPVSTRLYSSRENHQDDETSNHVNQKIKLIKQTNTLADLENRTAEDILNNPIRSPLTLTDEHYDELNFSLQRSNMIEKTANPSHSDTIPMRSSATSEVLRLSTSVSLRDLLSYQDVMKAIEREFHLHAGQEREIIMKLWLKGQTMISILQRFRHLLQDLKIDDQDFLQGLKQIREMINYSTRDVHYLREQNALLENQNRFLEAEFHRQLDRISQEKNEQITRLLHIIDQNCANLTNPKDRSNDGQQSSANEELSRRYLQQNADLKREIETLRARLEHTFTFVNEKFDQQKSAENTSSITALQTALEQIRQTESKAQEWKLKSTAQEEENHVLKYLLEKSQHVSTMDQAQLLNSVEQRSLEREISRVRHELEMRERKTAELEQRFEQADETVKFNIENIKLKCDVLRKHVDSCIEKLDQLNERSLIATKTESQIQKNPQGQRVTQLENDLSTLRERYDELLKHSETIKIELQTLRKQLYEKEKLETSSTSTLEEERRRVIQSESELRTLKVKYENVCERISAATHQLERVQGVLDQTSRRCEQLEKEKSEINAHSEHLSKNVVNVTTKYKDKLSTVKSRLEQTERDRREARTRSEQYQSEIDRLKDELIHKKEMIFEKEKIIQDTQFQHREIVREKQSIEERVSNEGRRFNELVDKHRLLEDELERTRRNQIADGLTYRRKEINDLDLSTSASSKQIEELRLKIEEFEQRFCEEKTTKESLQVQIKILEEENADLREIMVQMRKRMQDNRTDDRDRNDEIQQLIARTEFNVRQYMTSFNLNTLPLPSALVRITAVSSPTKAS